MRCSWGGSPCGSRNDGGGVQAADGLACKCTFLLYTAADLQGISAYELGRSAFSRHPRPRGARSRHRAQALAVDQTTVARRLRALEEGLGTALFERDEGSWRPTAVGARVLERAAHRGGRGRHHPPGEAGAGAVGGVVRITAVSALIGEWLVPRRPACTPSSGAARRPRRQQRQPQRRAPRGRHRHPPGAAWRAATSHPQARRRLLALYGAARGDLAVSAGDWVASGNDLDHTPEMRRLHAMLGEGRIRLRSNSLRGLVRAVAGGIGQWPAALLRRRCGPGLVRLSGAEPILHRELWMLIHPDARPLARRRDRGLAGGALRRGGRRGGRTPSRRRGAVSPRRAA